MHRILRLGHQRGFTLIEIAVVLLILSVILIAAMGVINAQVKKFGYEQTDKHREIVAEYVKMFLRTYRYLPCPAADQSGIEDRGGGGASTDPCNRDEGIIPFDTLGLDRDLALDGWDNLFTYRVTPSWTRSNTFGPGIPGILDNIDTGATEVSVVALISHGPNGLGAFNVSGQNAAPTDADEDDNRVGTGHAGEYNKRDVTAGSDYDDLVLALESTDLLAPLFADGSIESPLKTAQDDLRQAQQEILARTIAFRTSVLCTPIPPATTCAYAYELQYPLTGPDTIGAVAGPATYGVDPWGNPYTYIRGSAATYTSATSSNNPAYTVSSNGPPGGPAISVTISQSAFAGMLGAAAGFVAGN